MSLSVFDIASSRMALGRSSFFVMGRCGSEKVASTKTEFPSFVRATSQGRLSVMLGDETASYWEFSRSVPVYPRDQKPRVGFAASRCLRLRSVVEMVESDSREIDGR